MLVVSLAGPAVGLVLGAIGLALQGPLASQGPDVRSAVGMWTFVNLGWGVFNLMPIGILDGGQALAHLLKLGFGRPGQLFALASSIAFSAFVAVVAAARGYAFVALMAVLFGLANPYQYRVLFEGIFPRWAERRRQKEAELQRRLRASSRSRRSRPRPFLTTTGAVRNPEPTVGQPPAARGAPRRSRRSGARRRSRPGTRGWRMTIEPASRASHL